MTKNPELLFRFLLLALLAAHVGVSAVFRRRARREGGVIERRREEPWLVAARLAVTLPLLGCILIYLVRPAWLEPVTLSLPLGLRWLGVALVLAALPLNVWVLRSLGKNVSETVLTKEGHELVTTGPYRWIRHPLYSTGLVVLFGISLLTANALLLALTLVAAVLIRGVVIPQEEAALLAKFGKRYERLRKRTGSLWPRPSG